jgi:hypothetical protein
MRGNVIRVVRETEALELQKRFDPIGNQVHPSLDVLGVTELHAGPVELQGILPVHVDVLGLLVHLIRIEPQSQHQRGIHQPSARVREIRAGEIKETVQKQNDAVFVPVGVTPLGRVKERMAEADAGPGEAYHAA